MGQLLGDLPPQSEMAITDRLERVPISLGLVFGSYATGRADGESDLDIAVAYADDIADADIADEHLSLVADLTHILGRDDIDVVRLGTVDPRIATEALDRGTLLVGTDEAVQELRERLDAPRRRQEDAIDDHIEAAERKIERRIQRRAHGG